MAEAPLFCAEVTQDPWLGGKLSLRQLRHGQRAGTDAALLAAAFKALEGRVADVGAGVGAVGLALAQRHPQVQIDLIDINPDLVMLAGINSAENGLSDRVVVHCLDVLNDRLTLQALRGSYDALVTNPPFYQPMAARSPRDSARAQAHVLQNGTLEGWIKACRNLLKPRGVLVMIHLPQALSEILAGLGQGGQGHGGQGHGGQGLQILPVAPRRGAPASRIIARWQQASRAPLRLLAPLILHEASGAFTPEAEDLHRGRGSLPFDA